MLIRRPKRTKAAKGTVGQTVDQKEEQQEEEEQKSSRPHRALEAIPWLTVDCTWESQKGPAHVP